MTTASHHLYKIVEKVLNEHRDKITNWALDNLQQKYYKNTNQLGIWYLFR